MRKQILYTLVILFLASTTIVAKEINKSYSQKNELEVELVLGSCEFEKSQDENIHIRVEYSYDDEIFKAIFKEKNDKLSIEEKFGENDDNEGTSLWTISIPDGIEVEFSSATGDLSLNGIQSEFEGSSGTGSLTAEKVSGEFEMGSGTGNVEVSDSDGKFDLNSGTGNVRISNSRGEFDANSGTGKVVVKNIEIDDSADLNSGTGRVEVTGINGNDFELEISSGTGNVELNLDGKDVEAQYVLEAMDKPGKMTCPFKYDNIEEIDDGNSKRIRKTVNIGNSQSIISISSGTGKVILKK